MNDCRFGVSPVIYPDPDPGSRLHTRRTGLACCYITLDPDQHETLLQKTLASMMSYNTVSLTAVDFIPEELCHQAFI